MPDDPIDLILNRYHVRDCTSAEFMYDDMESQSGRCLAVIYRDLDLASRADWHDEGCILDFAASVGLRAQAVLDFGPGDGWPSLRIAAHVGRVVGVDTSKRRIRECEANARRLGIGNARFVHIERETALPFADASFDGVVAASSVEQTPDPGRTLAELARVLKPGGRLRLTYEGLARYRGGQERVGWLGLGPDGCAYVDLYDRDVIRDRALMIRIVTRLPPADLAAALGVPASGSFRLDALERERLGVIDDRVVEVRRCALRHPSGETWLKLLERAGFRSAAGTLDGGTAAVRLFEGRSAGAAPATHRELTRLLLPAVQEAVTVPAPIGSDPWITAVR